MAKYNIYLIDNLEGLEKSLGSDYRSVAEYESNGVKFKFYISNPQRGSIWWAEQYRDKLPAQCHDLYSSTYSAVLLAATAQNIYAISMGRSYTKVDDYCDKDFGVRLAQRLGDNTKSKMKNSTFNGGLKSRSIVSNSDYGNLDFSGGESISLLKMKPLEESGLGKSAIIFGSSVSISNSDITPNEIGDTLNDFDKVITQPPNFRVPRAVWVQDKNKIEKLTTKMIQAIESGDCDGKLDFFDYDQFGTSIFFTHEHRWKIKYKNDIHDNEYDDLSVETIRKFCNENRLKLSGVFNSLKVVVVSNDTGRTFTRDLIKFIDYTDDEEKCYLESGKWKQFNDDYIDDLKYWIEQVKLSNLDFEFSKLEFDEWCQNEKKTKNPAYKELFYNTKLSKQLNYELYDRKMDYRLKSGIEICDLYDTQNKKIIVTKRGEAKDFGYAVDQANSVLSLVMNGMYTSEKGTKIPIKELELLLILTKRKNKIKNLDEFKSFIFLSKINAIYALCREKGIEFGIRLSYENTTNTQKEYDKND